MEKNAQKYENWRTITESDYVTMFIKTWFAFVATLRELYPKDNLTDVIGKGDKVFLNPYLEDFEKKYLCYNKIIKVRDNILKVYKLGRCYVLENKKYNRFFVEDFYTINKFFHWKKVTEEYECSIKYASDFILSVHVKYLDKDFYVDNKPLIISEEIDISDLISSENLTELQIKQFLDDEAAYINYFTGEVIKRVSVNFISRITNLDFSTKYGSKECGRLNLLTTSINAELISALALMKDPTIHKDTLLVMQCPCANFVYKVEDGEDIPDVDTYKWFLNFVYFMRNALFHEIIDPLDTFWQDMFKHSYLALKEILDGNINYFLEKENVKNQVESKAWEELLDKADVYVPNFNELYNNGDLEIQFVDYVIDEVKIEVKANINLNYWYDEYSMKRMFSVGKFVITRNDGVIESFKMRLENLMDVQL